MKENKTKQTLQQFG